MTVGDVFRKRIDKNDFIRARSWFAVLSGLLLFFSFPKFGVGVLAWGALVPLLWALNRTTVTRGFMLGFLAGMVAHIGLFYWIATVVIRYGYQPVHVGVGATLLLASYLSLYTGFFSALTVYAGKQGVPLLFSAPTLWVALEYVKSHALTGFPWENLGYSQYLCHKLIQIVDLTGVYGISFLIVLTNVFLYNALFQRARHDFPLKQAVLLILLFLIVFVYGQYRIVSINRNIREIPPISVALIQGNIEQDIKWSPAYQKETLHIYDSLSKNVGLEPGGLMIWPETAAPFYFQQNTPLRHTLLETVIATHANLLFGSPSYEEEGGQLLYKNSAYLVRSDGVEIGRYDKVHLVPYGEYVPLRNLFPFIGKLVVGVGDFKAGIAYAPLALEGGLRIGTLICYEGIFPEGARRYKENGANLLVNITNDAWFGRTSAPYQHLSMTVFRAVENRLYVVRSANTGISAFVDPTGRILSKTGLFERTALRGTVQCVDEFTFYGAYSDLFVYVCAIVYLAVLFALVMKRRRGNE